jgi:hemerythrin-like domain-containing protein
VRLKEAQRLLLAAVAHSRRHFDREERIVFPMAERLLKPKTLSNLGQAWLSQRTRLAGTVTNSRSVPVPVLVSR